MRKIRASDVNTRMLALFLTVSLSFSGFVPARLIAADEGAAASEPTAVTQQAPTAEIEAALAAAEAAKAFTGTTMVLAPTGRVGADGVPVRVDFGLVPLADVGQVLASSKVIAPDATKVGVVVYLPTGLDPADERRFVDAVTTQLSAARADVAVERVYLDAGDYAAQAESANAEIRASVAAATAAGAPTIQAATAEAMIAENLRSVAAVRGWKQRMTDAIRQAFTPKGSVFVGRWLGIAKGVGSGGMLVVSAGLNPFVAGLGLLDAWTNYYFTKKARETDDWIERRRLPEFGGRNPLRVVNPFFRLFNTNDVLRISAINFVMWPLVYRFIQKSMLYFGGVPGLSAPWSTQFLIEAFSIGLLTTVIGAIGSSGLKALTEKGYIGNIVRTYQLWVLGFIGQVSVIAQLTEAYNLMYWTLGITWGARALSYIAGKVLPTREGRFLFVHPALGEDGARDAQLKEGVERTLASKDVTAEELMEKVQAMESRIDARSRMERLAAAIGERARSAIGALRGCLGVKYAKGNP